MTTRYAITFIEVEDGIVTHSGCFGETFESPDTASAEMVEDANRKLAEVNARRESRGEGKTGLDITDDDIGNMEIPALCVIRNFNGIDNDIYSWAVAPVSV